MNSVDKYLGLAIQIANEDRMRNTTRGKMHMCCVGVSRRTTVAQVNVQNSQTRHLPGHAERRVLNHFGDNEKVVLYVGRVDNYGKIALAKPCPNCMKAILGKSVSRVYYTTDSGFVCMSNVQGVQQ